jgi:preprotein translocase subunit SecB
MKLLWFFLSIFVGLHSALDMTAGKERRSTLNGTSPTILTPDFIETVQEIVDAGGVPGLTLAIVNKTGLAELGA